MAHHDDDRHEWDERYAGEEGRPLWSGRPNGTLVAEVADLAPARALDVGCGEGGDAIWLAQRGWQVTALDPSGVALARARAAATAAGVTVDWRQAGLLTADLGTYDLVSVQYGVVRRDDDRDLTVLLDAVAPGGTLLVAHHHLDPDDEHHEHHDAAVWPAAVAALLDDAWRVEIDERRARPGPLPPDARHVEDLVLRASRRR